MLRSFSFSFSIALKLPETFRNTPSVLRSRYRKLQELRKEKHFLFSRRRAEKKAFKRVVFKGSPCTRVISREGGRQGGKRRRRRLEKLKEKVPGEGYYGEVQLTQDTSRGKERRESTTAVNRFGIKVTLYRRLAFGCRIPPLTSESSSDASISPMSMSPPRGGIEGSREGMMMTCCHCVYTLNACLFNSSRRRSVARS